MSLNVGSLVGVLELDANPFMKGLDRVHAVGAQRASQLGDKLTAGLTLPLAAAGAVAVKAASDLQQAVGGTEAVFGEAGAAIDDYAKTAASASGLSEREFREATTSIGGQLKRMTGDVDLAAEQSMKLTGVAADLAATYGGTTAEAVQALGSAFRGEADPAERFNLNLKIGAVNAKAVEMGLAASEAAVSENARAQATLALIMEQSADATGQFARESDSAAGSMQIARAEMENASAEIGAALLPLVSGLAGGVADLASRFSELPDPVQKGVLAFAGLLAVTGPLLSMGGRVVDNWGKIAGAFDKGATAASNLAGKLNLAQAGALGLAGVAVGAAVNAWAREMNEASSDADEFVEAFAGASVRPVESMSELHDEIMRVGSAAAEMKRRGDEAMNPFLKSRLRDAEAGLNGVRDQLLEAESAAAKLQAELGITADEAAVMATNQELMAGALDEGTGEIDAQAAAAEKAVAAEKQLEDAIKGVTNALRSQFDPFFAATDAMLANEDAQRKVEEAHWAVTKASDDLAEAIEREGEESWAATDAARNLEEAQRDLSDRQREAGRSAIEVATSMTELRMRMKESGLSFEEGARLLDEWVAKGVIFEHQAQQMKEEMFYAALQAQELGKQRPTPVVDLDASLFWSKWSLVTAALGQDKRSMPQIGADGRFVTEGRWTGGPMLPGKEYITGEHGPELIRMTGGAAVALNAGQTREALGRAGGSSSTSHSRTVALTAQGNVIIQASDPREALDEAEHRMRMIELGNP